MIRDELYRDALRRLKELEQMRVVFVSDGTPGGDKVAALVAFAQAVIPDLERALESWFQSDSGDPVLEQIRFGLAMDALTQPIDQGMMHMIESFQRAVGDD